MAGTGKGLLLAASTRDDELTALAGTRAAHRLPVANRPLLSYGLSALYASGIEDVAVIVSPGTARDVRALLAGGTDRALQDRLPRDRRAAGPRAGAPRGGAVPRRPARDGPPRRRARLPAAAAALRGARALARRRDPAGAQRRRARRAAAGPPAGPARGRCDWSRTSPSRPPSRRSPASSCSARPASRPRSRCPTTPACRRSSARSARPAGGSRRGS